MSSQKKDKVLSIFLKLFLIGGSSFVFLYLFASTALAGINDLPLGINLEAEKASISRYLVSDFRFNEETSPNTDSLVDTIKNVSVLSFNGINNFLKLDNNPISFNEDFSIGAFIKLKDLNKVQTIIAQGTAANDYDYKLAINASNKVRFSINSSSNSAIEFDQTSGNELEKNVWYFILATGYYNPFSNNTNFKIYVNSEIVFEGSFTGTAVNTVNPNTPINIGRIADSNYFDGYMDKVFVAGKNLNQTQIDSWVDSKIHALPNIIAPNLFDGFWDFGEQSGTIAYDLSSNRRHATLQNYYLSGWYKSDQDTGRLGSYGMQFDGVDDFVTIDTPAGVYAQSEGTLEIAFMVNQFPEAGNKGTIFALSNKESGQLSILRTFVGSDRKLNYQIVENGQDLISANYSNQLNVNEWYHLVISNSVSNGHIVYLNGEVVNLTYQTGSASLHSWFDSYGNFVYRTMTLGSSRTNQKYTDFYSGAIQFVHNYPSFLDEKIVRMMYNFGKPKVLYENFKSFNFNIFEIDFLKDQGKIFRGEYSNTTAKINNILLRGPPSDDISNPLFYPSQNVKLTNSTSFVSIPVSATLKNSTKFTFGVAFRYLGATLPAGNAYLYREEQNSSTETLSLYLKPAGNVVCNVKDKNGVLIQIVSVQKYADSTWHNASCVFDSEANSYKLFVDNESVYLNSPNTEELSNVSPGSIFIGNRDNSGGNNFVGETDRVYAVKEVLNRSQIDQIFENQNSLVNQLSSPGSTYLVDYTFNQSIGNFLDESPNQFNIVSFDVSRNQQSISAQDNWQNEKIRSLGKTNTWINTNLNFDGIDDYINLNTKDDLATFDFLNNEISVEAWIKTSKTNGYIISKDNGLFKSWNLKLSNGRPKFEIYSGTTVSSIEGLTKLNDDSWHQIVGVYSGSNLSISIDGYTSNSAGGINISNINNFPTETIIGAYGDRSSDFFQGVISNINIFDVALLDNQILNQYLSSETDLKNNLRLSLRLNEGSGKVIYDNSANKITGVLNNFQEFSWVNPKSYLDFRKSTDHIRLNGVDSFSATSDLTLSIWVRPSGQMTGSDIVLVDNSNGQEVDNNSFTGYKMSLQNVSGNTFRLKSALGIASGRAYTISSNFILEENIWSNLLMRYNSSNGQIDLLKDGSVLSISSSQNGVGNIDYNTTNPFLLGADNLTLINSFRGGISDFKIWTKSLTNDEVNLVLKRYDSVIPDNLLTNLKVDLPLNEGSGFEIEDKTNSNIGGIIKNRIPWISNNAVLVNRKMKQNYSSALNLNYAKNEYIDLGPILTNNNNFALEAVVSANYGLASSGITIFDYGFGDQSSSGAKFKAEITPLKTLKVTISDGNVSENSVESYETFVNSIVPERFNNIKFGYNFQTKLLEVYLNNSLLLNQNTVLKMNASNNQAMNFQIRGNNSEATYRSLKIVQDSTNSIDNALDILRFGDSKKLDIDFSNIQSLEVLNKINSNYYEIKNGGSWISIPLQLNSDNKDIAEEVLTKKIDGQISVLGKGTSIKVENSTDIELGSSNFALEFWISPYNLKGVYPILEKGKAVYGDSTIANSMFLYLEDGKVMGWIAGTSPSIIASSATLEANKMYHFILTRDNSRSDSFGNMSLKYFKNGVIENYWSRFDYRGGLNNKDDLNIGFSKDTKGVTKLNPYFSGLIDEVRLIKRSYTQTELSTLNKIAENPNDLSLSIGTNTSSSSLVSRYSFNDNRSISLKDSRGFKDGVITADLIRFYNNGAKFDGKGGYIKVLSDTENSQNIKLGISNKFSIETWVELNNISKNQTIIYKEGANSRANYKLSYRANDGFVCTYGNSTTTKEVVSGNINLEMGMPHHVVCTYDAENQISIFVNGALRNTPISILGFSTQVSNNNLYIGDNGVSNDNDGLEGKLYQIRYWNKVLSFDAITEHTLNPFIYSYELNLDNLLSEWRFEEEDTENTLHNLYFSDLDGQLENITDVKSIWGEKKGKGFFDGKNDLIKISNDKKYNFNASEEFTIEAWVKISSNQSDDFISIVSKGNPYNNEAGFSLGFDNELKLPRFKISDGNSANSKELVALTSLADYNYHHLLVTRSITPNKLSLFVDSVLEDQIDASNLDLANDRFLTISGLQSSNGDFSNYFSGSIDEIRIYDAMMDEEKAYAEYIEGQNSINQVAYNLVLKNNSGQKITGDLYVNTLLPPYLEISPEVELFSAPELHVNADPSVSNPLISGDIFNGLNNEFYFSNLNVFPGEVFVLNFFARLNESYQIYTPERTSDLKIVAGVSPAVNSFASTIKINNPSGINGGNNIELGEQGHIQVQLLKDSSTSKYTKLSGGQNNSSINFLNSGSSGFTGLPGSHSPLSLEPPTINQLDRDDSEYLKIFKKKTNHPNLQLEYLIPSNSLNKYFYSIPLNNYDLRVQWKLADSPASISGFKWEQQQITNDNTINECANSDNDCVGTGQGQSTYSFNSWSNHSSEIDTVRRWKMQSNAESYSLTGNAGNFGTSYYFTYIKPMQGKYKFKIKVRDTIGLWGDDREIPFWVDSVAPSSTLVINGGNPKIKNPANPETDWWREGVNNVLTVSDDITKAVPQQLDNVSGIESIDYWIYSSMDSRDTVNDWERINDNDAGAGGVKARWNFNEAGNTFLFDQTTLHNGTIAYNSENYFWDQNGSAHFDGINDYVGFTGDILDFVDNMSIEAWVSVENNNPGVIISKWDDASKKSYKVTIENGEIHFFTSTNGNTTIESRSNGAGINANSTYHIIVSKFGTVPTYYVNGTSVTTINNVDRYLYNSDGHVFIGKQDKVANPTFFKGRISELRVYNRSIADTEALKHYNDGENGTVNSKTDNDSTIGKISAESDITDNGIFKMDYKTQDRATPPNVTGIKTHTVKIDKKPPVSAGIALPSSNIAMGDNGWFKAIGPNGAGVMKVSFQVDEGISTDRNYFDSGLKKLNVVHVINDKSADKFSVNWSNTGNLGAYLGFGTTLSSGSNFYQSISSVSTISCTDGNYNLPITEFGTITRSGTAIVYVGGCSYNLLPSELAKNVQEAINYTAALNNFYKFTYDNISKTFKIESLGVKETHPSSEFTYNYGKYNLSLILNEYYTQTSQGKHKFYFFAEDNAGNVETNIKDITFFVDTYRPTCPVITHASILPNAYAYKKDKTGGDYANYRNNSLVSYVESGYNKGSILTSKDTQGFLDPTLSQSETTPFMMWPKTDDFKNIGDTEGLQFSGNIKYGYHWEVADSSGDIGPGGKVIAAAPNNLNGFSAYKGIGPYSSGDYESIVLAHRGAIIPYQAGSTDDIPVPEIKLSDDGKSFFLWLKVKDNAGNENHCGQPGYEGAGPSYQYVYGNAKRFTTLQLFTDYSEKYVPLSQNAGSPTVFTAGPFIAGKEISFDKLYYNYDGTSYGSGVIPSTGSGGFESSKVVFLINNENVKLVSNAKLPIRFKDFTGVKITESYNPFRPTTGGAYLFSYFYLDPNAGATPYVTDYKIGSSAISIIVSGDNSLGLEEPYDINGVNAATNTAGRFWNFGIRQSAESTAPGVIGLSYFLGTGGTTTSQNHNMLLEPLSKLTNPYGQPEIIRGFTNVAGHYVLHAAIETSQEVYQYISIDFDILPDTPNFDCNTNGGKGECSELRLSPPASP